MNDRRSSAAGYVLPEYPFAAPPELRGEPARRYPVAIVGAGLAGLTLAADLAQRGIECVVLDEDNTVGVRGASSRGIVYVQKTLEIMARLGVYERIAEKGVTWSAGKVLAGEEVLYAFDYQPSSVSAQPPFTNLQQFYLEWFLVDRITTLGHANLRWKSRVVGVTPHVDRVALTIETPAGRYVLEADWCVAADGVNSTVRNLLALPQRTELGQDRWCITDVRFRRPRLNERWTWVEAGFNENRGVWQHLMADDVWRLDFQMAPDCDPAEVSRPEVARERVARMLGADTEFELVWVGPYAYRTMLMERFRHGRLMFIGDAAHAKSPFGARGGNSGVMDADNLGWKLARVVQGRSGEALLDSFDDERHRAAEENVRITARSGRFMQPRSEAEFRLRRAVLNLAREHAFARALLNTGRLCAPHHYRGLPAIGSGAHDGVALPNVALQQPVGRGGGRLTLIDLIRDAGENLLLCVFAPRESALVDAIARSALPIHPMFQGEDFDDPQALLTAQTGVQSGGALLIRPDAHLAAAFANVDAAAVIAAASRALAAQ